MGLNVIGRIVDAVVSIFDSLKGVAREGGKQIKKKRESVFWQQVGTAKRVKLATQILSEHHRPACKRVTMQKYRKKVGIEMSGGREPEDEELGVYLKSRGPSVSALEI